jgi:predicted nuclease with TOPRIM domain
MPLSQLKNIKVTFSLYGENSRPKAKLPIYIQYYEVSKNEWVSIYVATIEKGILSIEETTKSRAKALMAFFKIIKDNQIPELRIIAQKKLYSLEKKEVLTAMYAFYFEEENSLLHFDFGTAYLLNEELLKNQKGFRDFIVVTSPYSFANQKQNKKEIQRLEFSLKTCLANQDKLKEDLGESQIQLKGKEEQYNDLSNKFEEVKKQNESALKEYSILQENFESLQKEVNDCETAKEKINADLIKEQKENEKLNNKIAELNKKIKSTDNDLKEAKKEIKRLTPFENKYLDLKKDFDVLNETYKSKIRELEDCSKLNKELKDNYDSLLIEKQDYQEKLEICNSEKKQCEEERIKLNEKIKILEENLSNIEKDLSIKEDKIIELTSTIDELSKEIEFDMRPMPVSGVYANIVNEIQLAETLNKSNFKLANIQLKLKTLVNRDKEGVNLQFLNHQTAKEVNGNSISEVLMDIESSPNRVTELAKLPNLIGFTETAIRRILSNLGLRLNPVYQKTESNIPSGESFKQSPTLDSEIENNQLITVIFSKNEQSD